jgi:hypothetical protein
MKEAALAYAKRGLPVFPVWTVLQDGDRFICACSKGDCSNKANILLAPSCATASLTQQPTLNRLTIGGC